MMSLNWTGRGIAAVLILSFPLNLYASGLGNTPPVQEHRCQNLVPKEIEQKDYDPTISRTGSFDSAVVVGTYVGLCASNFSLNVIKLALWLVGCGAPIIAGAVLGPVVGLGYVGANYFYQKIKHFKNRKHLLSLEEMGEISGKVDDSQTIGCLDVMCDQNKPGTTAVMPESRFSTTRSRFSVGKKGFYVSKLVCSPAADPDAANISRNVFPDISTRATQAQNGPFSGPSHRLDDFNSIPGK